MPEAYGQRGWGTGSGGGPNIQAPIGQRVADQMGSMTGFGRAGIGPMSLRNPLYRKRFGEVSGGTKQAIGPGPLTELGIPAQGWVNNRENNQTGFDELQNLVDVRNNVNSGLGRAARGGMGQGAGFGGQDDMLRRLLQARMGGGGGF